MIRQRILQRGGTERETWQAEPTISGWPPAESLLFLPALRYDYPPSQGRGLTGGIMDLEGSRSSGR